MKIIRLSLLVRLLIISYVFIKLASCDSYTSRREWLLLRNNGDSDNRQSLFDMVKSVEDLSFSDHDTVFVHVFDDVYYYQQGIDRYLYGKWYCENDTLFFQTLCEYHSGIYPMICLSKKVCESPSDIKVFYPTRKGKETGVVYFAKNIQEEISLNKSDTIYSVLYYEYLIEKRNRLSYLLPDRCLLRLSMRGGIIDLTYLDVKHKRSPGFQIPWCNQFEDDYCQPQLNVNSDAK